VLARLQSLVLLVRTIYGHLHATQQSGCDGDSIGFPFHATTSFKLEADMVANPTASITVNAEKNEWSYVVLFGAHDGGMDRQTAIDSSRSN
jgi:hypothetical protein